MSSDRLAITAAYDELDAAFDKLLGLSFDGLTAQEKLTLQGRMERNLRRAPTVEHQLINSMVAEADPKALGGTSWADVLATKLGISKGEAKKRIKQAGLLGPRQALTGESLAPKLSNVAVAQARGQIGPEHVRIIEKFFDGLPGHIDYQTRRPPRPIWPALPRSWGPRSSASRLTGWHCCSIRTASHPPTPNEPGGGI